MGIPTAIAAVAQLVGSIISSRSKPNAGKTTQIPRFSKGQQGYQNQILGGLGPATSSGMQNINNILSNAPGAFSAFEAPFKTQFNQQTVPQLAERFSGFGGGAQSSSAFQQALGQAGAGLSEKLASLRGSLQNDALGRLLGFGQLGMEPSFESIYQKGTPGAQQALGQGIGNIGSQLLPYGLQKLFSENPANPSSNQTEGNSGLDSMSPQDQQEFISIIQKLFGK